MNIEVENAGQFVTIAKEHNPIKGLAFQAIDLRDYEDIIFNKEFKNCVFLGCDLSTKAQNKLIQSGNMFFPKMDLPFQVYRNKLYNHSDLYNGFSFTKPESYASTNDFLIYKYYESKGKGEPENIQDSLAQRLHDHAITDALYDYLSLWDSRRIVAIMGGHSLPRDAEDYRKIVLISKALAEKGHLMISGGGPGGMEATHLGAWMAYKDEKAVDEAIEILSKAPLYNDKLWLSAAFEVMQAYPMQTIVESVGIPTWFYGHEPPTPFATHIAKYFANSVREEGLLAIAKGGVIFAPGSAGTVQEIFQEAAQNHYETFGNVSPMVFLNKKYWEEEKPVYPLVKKLADGYKYSELLGIADKPSEIVKTICNFTGK
ncbi:putative Rossmann-fold nucleotide-binding protein [Balneicella halophila]|uniref:Putative Rossmann-fold nucleotide-binding protein n=1 Tax=Balneicella halophila TaxID=1537566 RepID=A0A7L4USY8_BALHA|nr:hypothetical protein [Balneicella halophila]PVX52144.1 putative Rossmann-fold nucleotide-binding protein [Balneicella halophila]